MHRFPSAATFVDDKNERERIMANLTAELVLDARAELGECPIWSVEEQRLWWIDIDGKALHRFDPASGGDESWPLPAMPAASCCARGAE